MRQHAGAARSARIGVRLSSEEQHQVDAAAKTRGYANPSAFVRAAIRNELKGRAEMTGTEERIAGGFDGVSRDIFRVDRGQQALFALVDRFCQGGSDLRAGTAARRQATGHRPRQRAIRPAHQGRRSSDVGRCAHSHGGSGKPWHEMTGRGKPGSGRQSLALRATNERRGRAASVFSCTTPA